MFNWIKNLNKGNKPNSISSPLDANRQTRVVKRIVPSSLRQAEEEAEATALAEREAIAKIEVKESPTITLTPSLPKPAPAAISMRREESSESSENPAVTPPPMVRLSSSDTNQEASGAEPVRLTTARKKPALNFGSAPAATNNREIVLTVSDFVSRIPGHFIDEKAVSGSTEVRFDAADLYSDMTKGRATVPLSIIAEVIPALFKRRLSAEEDIEIQLPLPKIVAQMGDLFTRPDQEAPESFEQVETPFLKAALRDQEIHKVSGAVAAPMPVKPLAPKPAPVEEAAPPSVVRPKPVGLKLTPTPVAEEPARPVASKPNPKITNRRVTVRIRPLIQAMPIQQREMIMGNIHEDSQVDLPLDEIENQLSSGKVSLSLETFSDALDPSMRQMFKDNFTGNDVPISLAEIVKNLPNNSFNMREDQHEQEVDPDEFETPFNTTPDTIAKKPVPPSPLSAAIPPPSSPLRAKPLITPSITNYTTRKLNNTAGKFPSPMHAALGTQDPLDAKKVVKLASALPGVASLTIITEDGLGLAGNLPSFMDPEGFSAMAPQLHRKMAAHANDMKLGELKHLSLSTETHTVTIFTGSGITIAVLHQNQSDLGHGVKEKFIAIVDGLAKQYNPEVAAN